MFIRFFTRKDFGGWRSLIWLPVSLVQGKYIHCEIEVDGVVLNADNKDGVVCRQPSQFTPSAQKYIAYNKSMYNEEACRLLGQKYSWGGFFGLLLPKWGNDPKGMICSELVAHMLATCSFRGHYFGRRVHNVGLRAQTGDHAAAC